MTNFGPPVGGSPEPWGGRRPDDAYAPPADPRYDPQPGGWGEPPAQRYEPTGWEEQPSRQSAYPAAYPPYQQTARQGYAPAGSPGYPPASPYVGDGHPYADPPPPPKRGKGPLITVLAVLAVLLLGGAATVYLLGRDDAAPQAGSTEAPATDPAAAATEPAPATTAPAPASSADPRFVKAGQCVRNEGPAGGKPKLLISECGAKTYQVLRRFDGATSGEKDAQAKCAKVDGYTNWYFFDSELDTLDFVLCLKQR